MAAATVVSITGSGCYIKQVAGGDYTMSRDDFLVEVDASGAACNITLPAGGGYIGHVYSIVRTAGILNAVSAIGTGGPFVIALPLLSCGQFICNGTTWRRVGTI